MSAVTFRNATLINKYLNVCHNGKIKDGLWKLVFLNNTFWMQEACKITKIQKELREEIFLNFTHIYNIKYVILECPSKAFRVLLSEKEHFLQIKEKLWDKK